MSLNEVGHYSGRPFKLPIYAKLDYGTGIFRDLVVPNVR